MADQNEERERMRQSQEALRQQVSTALERALEDTEFRRRLLDEPRTALGISEPPRGQAPEEFMRQRKELLSAVIARAESDTAFRTGLKSEPLKTIRDTFGPQVEKLRAAVPQPDVRAYGAWWWGGGWWTPWW
jgi:hypothetical protein